MKRNPDGYTRPNLSKFQGLKNSYFYALKNVDRRILKLLSCETFGQELYSLQLSHSLICIPSTGAPAK